MLHAFYLQLNNIEGASNNPFIDFISNVIEPQSSYIETENIFTIQDIIRFKNFKYLSYKGSLTTPNCTENVTWIVSTTPLSISSMQLRQFRRMKNEKGNLLLSNFRPLQHLNYRDVYLY